eukprot:CAMPEP_0182576280 /NCGR_PEP_ID=MMETSP1324-20130603/33256_1 /TAXON_ID=236786 /ORGANISM="Florenciella sp., Strain RCC1587" /LENGTH=50 /DNA_ID=CAMNT_0024791961 /DNA_START=89 /DNA_END=238 /DNA_ORIENTATION=+
MVASASVCGATLGSISFHLGIEWNAGATGAGFEGPRMAAPWTANDGPSER